MVKFERLNIKPSSAVDYIEYDAGREVLRVAWASGSGTEYDQIKPKVVEYLETARSVGAALNILVRPLPGRKVW